MYRGRLAWRGRSVSRLAISNWAHPGQMHFVPLTETGLPATFKFSGGGALVAALDKLDKKYCVRVSVAAEATVVFVLVGRYREGWGGLVGAGVWSDGLSD